MRPVRVQVFARDPAPGRTKTRLIPALGAEGACRCYLCLLDATLACVRSAGFETLELWSDRPPEGPALRARADALGAALHVQAGDDLGARMAAALEHALAAGALPVLVGSDLPGLTPVHLRAAAAALEGGAEAVFAPAEDGGYGLVGLARPWPELFEGVPWGTDAVMAETRARAAGRGLVELEPLWDVDEPADLARLAGRPGFEACRP
ncbi:MAG: TIGR04282 family arsenosugar biosynthesis glycosyltransferase [Pseudomonadales bacterium]|jgi:rSAM/selenodomain-associated transferase 1|nr:TIGR04282 family arsenosugar biosynthesis glycosyltransferase [Pseudomonadales bacterium]